MPLCLAAGRAFDGEKMHDSLSGLTTRLRDGGPTAHGSRRDALPALAAAHCRPVDVSLCLLSDNYVPLN